MGTDNYFNDISELIKKHGDFDKVRDAGYDIDSPDNFYLDTLREDLIQLKQGQDILSPQYLVDGTGKSKPKSIPVKHNKVIIAEGIAPSYDKVSDLFDIKIFVKTDDKIRQKRFMERAKLRNQDNENALKHWNYVKQAGKNYVSIHEDESDVVINGDYDLDYLTDIIGRIHRATDSQNND